MNIEKTLADAAALEKGNMLLVCDGLNVEQPSQFPYDHFVHDGTKLLNKYVEDGMIRKQRHPIFPLTIYNYTQRATKMFKTPAEWPEVVKSARGLVLDDDGNLIARGFAKFFNYSEIIDQVPLNEEPVYTCKYDGSLILVFRYDNYLLFATRGSFTSEQAVWARKKFRFFYPLEKLTSYGVTYLFEAIYPENRVVVDYGEREDLIYLGFLSRNNNNQQNFNPYDRYSHDLMRVAYDSTPSLSSGKPVKPPILTTYQIESQFRDGGQDGTKEGFVVYWPSKKLMAKIKFDEYVRRHRIRFSMTTRRVWELAQQPSEDLDCLPKEDRDIVMEAINQLHLCYTTHLDTAQVILSKLLMDKVPRTRFKKVVESEHNSFYLPTIFALLDAMEHSAHYNSAAVSTATTKVANRIWKTLKPQHSELLFKSVKDKEGKE